MAHEVAVRVFAGNPPTPERLAELQALVDRVVSTAGLRGTPVPHFVIDQVDAFTANPSAISFAHGRGTGVAGLQAQTDGQLVRRAGEIVTSIGPVLGIGRAHGSEFVASADVTEVTAAARIVRLAQRHQGIPVFHATNAVRFGASGEPAALVGTTVTFDTDLDPVPAQTADSAVLAAARFVTAPDTDTELDQFGVRIPPIDIHLDGFQPRQLVQDGDAQRLTVFDAGPFAEPIRASLLWFPVVASDVRLAWLVLLALPGGFPRYKVLVDASTAQVLYTRQLVQGVRAAAAVYRVDGSGPREWVDLPVPLDSHGLPLPADLPDGFPPDWVAADRTEGNSTQARFADTDQTVMATVTDGQVRFEPVAATGDGQNVLNAFYLACRLHDYFYLLGFREKDWNFQLSNASAGGVGGDPVEVQAHPDALPLTSSMHTEPEGSSPTLKLGLVPETGRHCALDASVVAHEFTHGVTNRLVGGPNDAHALDDQQCRGMGEGWGDYVACTMLDKTVVGDWLVDNPGGIRKFRYDTSFPASTDHFGKLGKGRYRDEHAGGEIWAATLLEMNRSIGATLGLQLVVHALKLTATNPSFLVMRDAILAAVDVMVDSGDVTAAAAPSTREGIWRAFAKFGMGPGARCSGASFDGIVPDFTVPPPETGTSRDPFGRAPAPATITVSTAPEDAMALAPDTPDAQSTLTVVDPRVVTAVTVSIDIEHPATEDLRVTLVSPANVRVVLHNRTPAGPHLDRSYTPPDTPGLASLIGRTGTGDWSLVVVDVVADSEGRLNGWSLELGLAADQEAAEASPTVPIPDNSPTGVESPVTLTLAGLVAALTVQVQLNHAEPADVRIELVAPSGRSAVLREVSEPSAGLVQTYDSSSSPRLAELQGERMDGTWRLRVADCVAGDTGTLVRWRLTAKPQLGGTGATETAPGPPRDSPRTAPPGAGP